MKTISRLFIAIAFVALAVFPNTAQAAIPIPTTPINYQTASPLISSPIILQPITVATRSVSIDISRYSQCGAQYVLDQGATPNTVTLAFQASNDGTNWEAFTANSVTPSNVVTSSAADATGFYIFNTPIARFVSISTTTTNTNAVTTTLRLICK